MSWIEYPLPAFDGGLNSKYEPYIIADNESPDCLNCYSTDLGGVRTRWGSARLNTTAVGSFANHGLFTLRYNNSNQSMVGWWNGTMYALSGTTFNTIPSAQSVYTAGQYVCHVQYLNIGIFGNGYSPNYKYNGTNFNRFSIPQPNSGPTASGTSTGTLTGSFQYKVSYINSFAVEGDVSSNTTTVTYASLIGGLTSIPVAPTSFGVVSRRLYRKNVASGTTFLLLHEFSDNTTTVYADNTPDASLGAAAPLDQGEAPKFEFSIQHKDRMFFKQPGDPIIYYSELGEPFTVKALNFLSVGDGDGEMTTAFGIHADGVVCYKQTGAVLIYMPDADPTNWSIIRLNSKYGASGHFSICDYEKYQMHMGRNIEGAVNFAALGGGAESPGITNTNVANIIADSKSDRIEPDIRQFATDYTSKIFGIRFDNKIWYAVPFGALSTTNNRVYVFDYFQRDKDRANGAWWPLEFPFSISYFTILNSKLYAASGTANGLVYQLEVSGSFYDDGGDIDSYFYTREFEGFKEQKEHWKDFRRIHLTLGTLGNWDIGIGYVLDAQEGGANVQNVNIDPGATLWGSLIWGTSLWGGGSSRKLYRLQLGTASGTKIQFLFDNRDTGGRGFEVLRGTYFYNDRGLR